MIELGYTSIEWTTVNQIITILSLVFGVTLGQGQISYILLYR